MLGQGLADCLRLREGLAVAMLGAFQLQSEGLEGGLVRLERVLEGPGFVLEDGLVLHEVEAGALGDLQLQVPGGQSPAQCLELGSQVLLGQPPIPQL